MSAPRAIVTATTTALGRTVGSALEEDGWEVETAAAGVDCVEKARAAPPDLLVLVPPLLWGCVAGVLAVLHDDPATRRVPVLVLAQPTGDGPSPAAARPGRAGRSEGPAALASLIDRAFARVQGTAPAVPAP